MSAGLALMIAALCVCVGGNASAATPAVTIKMSDTPPKFLPEKVTIKAGQTVEWINTAQTLHSVDADPTMVQDAKDVVLPMGTKPFDSGFMGPGAKFDYTFTTPGVYKYTCVPHEKDGMMGTIEVTK